MRSIQNYNPSMLTLARNYRMISQRELSKITSIPQTALSRYESGITAPDSASLEVICEKLGFPKSFFCSTSRIYPPATPFHRKRITVSKKIVESAEALGNIQRIHILSMLSQLEQLPNNLPSIPIDDDNDSTDTAIKIAQYTRRSLGLPRGPIDNMTDLLESHGAFVSFVKFESDKIDGFTLRGGLGDHPTIFINNNFQAEKDRMTLAHELGHIIMHQIPTETCEDEAWAFASEFLMPKEEIRHDLPMNITNIRQLLPLKKKWKVSMKALVRKSLDLGCITMNTAKYLYSQLAPYKKYEPMPLEKEKPFLISSLIDFYKVEMEYTDKQVLDFIGISKELFYEWYVNNERPKLRLIKQ